MSADIPIPHFYRPLPRTGDALPACADCLSAPTDPTFGEHHEPSRSDRHVTADEPGLRASHDRRMCGPECTV